MPIFENNGKKQNVQDAHVGKYMELYPDATTVMERDGKKYRVKAKDYNTFLGDTLEAPKMESAPQPAPQVEAEPQQKAYAQAARPTADAVPQLEADKSAYTFTAEELGIEESNGNAPAAPVELQYDGTKPVVPGMAKEGDIPGIDMEAYNANMAKAMAEGKVLSPQETQRRFEEREAEVAARLPQARARMSADAQVAATMKGAFDRAYGAAKGVYYADEAERLTKGLLDEYSAERAKRLSQVEKDVENYNSARRWAVSNPYATDAYSEVAYRSNATKLRNADELGMMEEFAKDAKKRLLADENLKAKAEENAELLGMPVERYINEVAVPIMQERMYSEWLAPQEERAKRNYNGFAAAAEGSLIGTLLGATRTDTEKYLSQVGQEAWRKNASLLGRAAAGAGSMFLDLPVFMGAGSLASVPAKAVGGQVFKQLAKNETKRLVARGVAEGAAQRYANYAVRNGLKNRILLNLSTAPLQSGLTFGMFDAGKAALNMSLNGEWDWKELGKSAVGGTLMGGALGATGAVGGGLTHGLTGATKAAAKVAEFGVENAVFTEGGRLIGKLHGQQPENGWLEDYVESGATLLMIKAPNIVKNVSAIKGDKEASEVFAFNRLEREQLGKYGEDLNAVLESLLPKSGRLYEDGLKINEGTFTEEYRRVMSDPEVPMTAKAKLMGIVEGKVMPAPRVVDAKIEGNRVMTYDPMGRLVEVKEYATEAKANAEYKKVANAAEVESIAVMEDMYMRIKGYEADDVTVREWLAKNPTVTAEDIANIIAKNSAGEKLTEGEQRILESLRKARHEGLNDVRFLNDVLAELDVDPKDVMSGIEKPIDERTEAENRAVKAYTDVLYQEIKAKVEPFRRGEARRAEDVDTTVRLIESDRSVDETANDGMVYTTTTPSGEKIIITGGKVVLDNEGYIDINQSEGLVAMFPDGQKKPVRPGDLREKVEVSNAEEIKVVKREEIEQEIAAENGWKPIEVGAEYDVVFDGDAFRVKVKGRDENGDVIISGEGASMAVPESFLQDAMKQAEAVGEMPIATEPVVAPVESTVPTAEEVADAQAFADAYAANTMDAYQNYLDKFPEGAYREGARRGIWALEGTSSVADIASITNAENVLQRAAANEVQPEVAPVVEDQIGDNTEKVVEPADGAAAPVVEAPKTALEQIPRNENNIPLYEQVDSELAWDGVVEEAGGNEETAMIAVNSMIADKQDALKKAEKAKAKAGVTITEKIAAENERVANIEKAKADLAKWEEIAGVKAKRALAAEAESKRVADEAAAKQRAEEERLRAEREAAERAEREALNGVPDMVDDKPQDARARGYRRVNGHKVDRQEPVQGLMGKEIAVKFSDSSIPTGRVAVIEAEQLQPSHIQGQRNPLHFIDEAQPKERNDAASVLSARKIAENVRPEEITSSVTAYTGAPTVNARGEAVQGNNRSAALRLMWENNPEQAAKYKQYLMDHAAEFGLNAEDVAAMERPVLVNMLDVSDADAITLGQYVAQDTESGGTERIKPKNVMQKMGGDMRSFANKLLASNNEEASFAELVDANGVEVLKWMAQKGYITPTQYKSAFDSKGNLTAEVKNDLRDVMYQSIFKGGSTQLEEMFNALPAKAQKAILATAFRDYDSPSGERMNGEVQNSIRAYYALARDAAFANAKNYKEAKEAAMMWARQYQLDDVSGESFLPSENFSNFAIELAIVYKGWTQRNLQNHFNNIYDLVQGTKEASLFEEADNTPRTLKEAIKETFNIDYNGQSNSNSLAIDSKDGQARKRGGNGDIATGERIEGGERPADSTGGTRGNGEVSSPEIPNSSTGEVVSPVEANAEGGNAPGQRKMYSPEELAEAKEQLGELNATSAPAFAARLFSIKPWKTLEEANAALKELLASYGETLNGQSLAVMPFLDKAQGLIREYNKSQEPRSVEEVLENGDKRITNYNSRGEVATVATERDGKVVSVDSYDEGVLFEHTEYDTNGVSTSVTRYDKQGNAIGTQVYVDGKAVPSETAEQPETGEVADAGPVNRETLQLNMSEEDFNALLNSGDKAAISEYLAEMDGLLRIGAGSPLDGRDAIVKEYRGVVEQYGGEENIPADVVAGFDERIAPYNALQRAVFDRKYALQDKLREIEANEAQAKEQAEKEAKAEHKKIAFGGFLAEKTDLGASAAEKALNKRYKFGDSVHTVAEYIEQQLEKGTLKIETREEPKYKGVSRQAWNRMDARQQAAEEKRVKEGGMKTIYSVNSMDLGKTAYDYAKFLLDKKAEQEKAAAKQKVKDAIEPFAKEKAAEQAPIKIEDVGEKIGGAKKDRFAEGMARIKAELEETDETLTDKLAKLPVSQVFNFDLEKLREGGISNEAISFIKIVKDYLPAKPRKTYKIRSWVNNTLALYKLCLEAGTNWDRVNTLLNGPQFTSSSLKEQFDAYMAIGGFDSGMNIGDAKLRQLDKTSGRYDENGKFVTLAGKWYVRDAGKHGGIYDTKEEAVNALKAFAGDKAGVTSSGKKKEVKFAVYQRRQDKSIFIAVKGKSDIVIQDGFASSKEAFDYIEANNAELQERYRALLDKTNADFEDNRPREGRDYRDGKDIPAEEFRTTFGFRGVEFGNWMTQEDRRKALNECYDALMDLAAVCKVSPQALSLGGTLGMAFGARGGGRFSAHYEPGKLVINLTKTKGAGSLAHEWFHALDNYFAKMGSEGLDVYATAGEGLFPEGVSSIGKRYYDRKSGQMLTEEEYNERMNSHEVRREMADAWKSLMETLKKSDYYKRSLAYAGLHNSNYWSRPTELGARAFSTWVENELSKQGASNDYLANNPRFLVSEATDEQSRFMPYPFDADATWMEEAFGNLFEVMQEKTTEDGKAVFYSIAEDAMLQDKGTEAFERATKVTMDAVERLKANGLDIEVVSQEEAEEMAELAEAQNAEMQTSKEIEAKYPDWLEGTTTESGKHSTQVEGTRKTYKKVGDWIDENMGKDVAILDASSGMGYGTADLRERGFNIEDVEPYQSEERKQNNPATYSSYADIEKQYDYIISNAVLNVIPDDWRTDVLHNMADKLKDGGKLFINTRKAGEERFIKDKIELDSPQEVLVKRNGRIASYQRFFTPQELKEWVESELGDGYTVEIANKANSGTNGLAAVVVTKNNESPANGKTSELGQPILKKKNAPLANVAAKVSKNAERASRLDAIISSIEKIGEMGPHEFLHEVVNAMLLSQDISTKKSRYAKLGGGVTLRLANHYGNAETFKEHKDQTENYGLVIKLSNNPFKPDKDVDYLEYVYFPDKLTKERQIEIAKGLKAFMEMGRYDLLPKPDKVNPSGKFVGRTELSTTDGKVYGWAVDGKIRLTPDGINPNTPVHEYAHLWGADVEKNNPKLWNEVVEAMKLSPIWNEVANDANYSNIHGNDSRMASEVLARLSGRENYRRTMEEAEKEIAAESDIVGKVQKKGILNRIKNALKNFWNWVQRNVFKRGERSNVKAESESASEVMPWEEFANSVVGDFYKGKNPDVKESALEKMFMGEKGAANLDKAEEATTRLDNLNVAREMETAGKDAKSIKLATGWERGADGKWRYEVMDDFELDLDANVAYGKRNPEVIKRRNRWRELLHKGNALAFEGELLSADETAEFESLSAEFKGTQLHNSRTLKDYIDAPELFEAYPEVADIKVSIEALDENEKGSYSPIENIIRLNNELGKGEIKSTLNHEIQHAIQYIEGFARGGNTEDVLTRAQALRGDVRPLYDMMLETPEWAEKKRLVNRWLAEEDKAEPDRDYQAQLWERIEEINNSGVLDDIQQLQDRLIKKYGLDRTVTEIISGPYAMDAEVWSNLPESFYDKYDAYKRLAGEVEARNVQERMGMSPEERRGKLAEETEDVRREDQIFMYDNLGVSASEVAEEDIPVESVQTQPMTFAEKITNSVLEASAKNKENLALRSDALRMFGRDVANILKLMGKQREYDKSTVDQLVKLAKMYFKDAQLLGGLTPYQVGRVMTRLNNAVGKRDITDDANELVNILVDAHNKELEKMLEKQAKTKAKKVNTSGVEVIGKLDKEGQLLLEEYNAGKELDLESIDDKIIDLQNEAADASGNVEGESGEPDAERTREVAARLRGLELAREYREEILKKRDEIKGLEQELKNAEKDVKDGVMTKDAYKEFRRATERAILESKLEMVDAYHGLIHGLGGDISSSAKRAKLFQQQQIDHVKEIQHNANSDLLGHPAEAQGETPDKWNSSVPRLFMSAMPTFQTMLKFFGEKAADGRGYLYERFIPQHTQASHNEYVGKTEAREKMRNKLTEIFGKKTSIEDFLDMSRKEGAVLEYQEGGQKKTIDLTRGQVLYLYMINKMADGQMKLSRMGITDADVLKMAKELPEEMVRFADWVQEEFLTELREKYNKVHERMFGAPMAAIESYFPIKINKRSRGEKIEPGMNAEDKPSTVTGSVIKRTKNAVAIDLSADAMQVLLGHIDDMENWAAWAEFRRDVKSLLNYRHFQNQVKGMESLRYGSGEKLWKNFVDVANIAAGSFKPSSTAADRAVRNIAKGVVSSKIAFRSFTAVKQILSTPAFWSEVDFGKMMNAYLHQKEAWDWAMKNLPGFSKRWEGRASGNEILLESDADWKVWQNRAVQWLSKEGMRANAFIDALTVATGAKAVFETKYEMFKKAGYSEERAREKALNRAAEAYNESQQSSESAYLSPLQAEATFVSSVLTAYRNSPFGYNRKMATAIANLKKKMKKGFKQESIEYMTKQLMRDGLNEEQAKEYAKSTYRRSVARDAADVALYEFFLNYVWVLGPSLIYILGGDDDEKKKELNVEALIDGAMGGLGNLPAGETLTGAIKAIAEGDVSNFKLPQAVAMQDMETIADLMQTDPVRAAGEVLNILVAMGVGVNPQTFTDMFVALADTEDWSDPREIAMLVLRLINAPNSKLELLEADEAMENYGANIEEITREYAEYQKSKRAPLSGWLYSDESEQKAIERYEKRFKKILDERFEVVVENTDEYDMWYENSDPQMKAKLAKLRQKFLEGDKETTMEKLDSIDVTKKVLFGSGYDEVNTVYYELSTAEDEDMAMMIDTKLKELQPMMDEYKKLRGDERKAYREENLEQIQFYNRLNAHKNNVNNLKGAMKKEPEEAQEKMEKIRKIRTKAIDLINNYNE